MNCPGCKKQLPYDKAVNRNKWGDKECPFCQTHIAMTIGIFPKHAARWELITPEDDSHIAKIRCGG